nr:methyltransferase domain-containing protein [Sterolibacterium denitrificans]
MPIQGFDDWLDTPQGRYVLQWEQAKHDQLVADIFGFNAVQLGLPQYDFLRANRMPFRLHCDDLPGGIGSGRLITNPHYLPFASASMDLVVLPHLLEFHEAPHQILREVERVLVPEGSVIVTGFNPFSLWGLRRRFTRAAGAPPPWRGHYLSVMRLKDWFALLGLETHSGSFGCYAPPFSQENHLRRWRFIELAGNRWWPYGGATYIIQAIKRTHGMRLIPPGWRERMMHAKALATVTAPRPRPRPSSRSSRFNLQNCNKPEES